MSTIKFTESLPVKWGHEKLLHTVYYDHTTHLVYVRVVGADYWFAYPCSDDAWNAWDLNDPLTYVNKTFGAAKYVASYHESETNFFLRPFLQRAAEDALPSDSAEPTNEWTVVYRLDGTQHTATIKENDAAAATEYVVSWALKLGLKVDVLAVLPSIPTSLWSECPECGRGYDD